MNTQAISDKFNRSAISIHRTRLTCQWNRTLRNGSECYSPLPFLFLTTKWLLDGAKNEVSKFFQVPFSQIIAYLPFFIPNGSIIRRDILSSLFFIAGFDALKSTSTPLLSRAGMCMLIDVALKGLFLTSTQSPSPNPAFATSGARSEMLLSLSSKPFRLIKLDIGVISAMLLSESSSHLRLVKLDSGVTFDMLL